MKVDRISSFVLELICSSFFPSHVSYEHSFFLVGSSIFATSLHLSEMVTMPEDSNHRMQKDKEQMDPGLDKEHDDDGGNGALAFDGED